jgi:hypothetical protein
MNKIILSLALLLITFLSSCKKDDPEFFVNEDPATFAEIGTVDIGDAGAAEISAYDPQTKRLFVVNNAAGINRVEVLDFADPTKPTVIGNISLTNYSGAANSVSVANGRLAVALESSNKQDPGKVVVFNTQTYAEVKVITVGALPDMITYSPNGNFILTANEGEPSADYTNDPDGSVSIISVNDNYSVVTLNFASLASQQATLANGGFRIFGLNATFAKDIEPEYITVSDDSQTAWVTLQENNGIAKINLNTKTITDIFPLGFKDYNMNGNEVNISDRDDSNRTLAKWNVKGMYQPDAIAFMLSGGVPYLFTANEGDAREYTAFSEMKRVKDLTLDATAFPETDFKTDAKAGRLNVTTTLGDIGADGDFEALYSLGARSFSVWNGNSGALEFDSKNELDVKCIAENIYDDGRSDDKSVEPEGIAIGTVGTRQVAFVGLERADAVAIYDVTNPKSPVFLKIVKSGDAPEGILFIPAKDSPIQQSLLIVSSEGDGVIKVYKPNLL